jgi:hypothetical protein
LPLAETVPRVADPPAVPFTFQLTVVLGFPETLARNANESPARMFAVVGLIVTVVEPGVLGSDGDVGLGLPVVAVFATPPHAQVTSARRSGRVCTAERIVEQLAVRIAWGTPVKGSVLQPFWKATARFGYWTMV